MTQPTSDHLESTARQYLEVIRDCRALFVAKMTDYGPSWLVFRLPSLTDQILIKAKRIRNLEMLEGGRKVEDDESAEYRGIANYCMMALIRIWHDKSLPDPWATSEQSESAVAEIAEKLVALYDDTAGRTEQLMRKKNHDYGEAWRDLALPSITDQILVKLARLKQIHANQGKTAVSESEEGHYCDILNWSVFALIKIAEASDAAS